VKWLEGFDWGGIWAKHVAMGNHKEWRVKWRQGVERGEGLAQHVAMGNYEEWGGGPDILLRGVTGKEWS
jgi:hypothetical protein